MIKNFSRLIICSLGFSIIFSPVSTLAFRSQNQSSPRINHMGQIDSSPKTQWAKGFLMKVSGSEDSFSLIVNQSHSLREDGLADPSRPGGPDNRNIVTDVSYSVYILDSKADLVTDSSSEGSGKTAEARKKLEALVDHLKENNGVKGIQKSAHFVDDQFSEVLVQFAKENYGISLEIANTGLNSR